MAIDKTASASQIAAAMLASLRGGGGKVKALALAEAEKLATSVATVGELFAAGQIDAEEAAVQLRIQRDASEAVLASLAETSRLSAHRALAAGLKEIAEIAGNALAGPVRMAVLAA